MYLSLCVAVWEARASGLGNVVLPVCLRSSQELVRQLLSALRAIAGNDDVKDAIVNAGGVELIVIAMNRHITNAQVSQGSLPGVRVCVSV